MSTTGWIGVDLDGTLAHYDGWKGLEHVGAPVPAMLERVKYWLKTGKDVRIFTARVCREGQEREDAEFHIQKWLIQHVGRELVVTNVKDFGMVELWDDRAVQVEANTGRRMDEHG